MKKQILSLVAIVGLAFIAQAQETKPFGFEKGNFLVEGNLMYSSTDDKGDEEKQSNFEFSPKVGYFVTEKFVAGVELSVGSQKMDYYGDDYIEKTNSFGAGVFGRYYFLDLGQRFKVYGEANLGLVNSKYTEEYDGNSDDVKFNGFAAGAGLGINYFVTDKFAINFGLSDIVSYNTMKGDWNGAESVNNFDANINVFNNFFSTAQFGLTYKF